LVVRRDFLLLPLCFPVADARVVRFFPVVLFPLVFFFAFFGRPEVLPVRDGLAGRARFAARFTVATADPDRPRPLRPARAAPTTPPTTVPIGPAMLPKAAPATAPAVSFGIGGTLMFSPPLLCLSFSSAINAFLLPQLIPSGGMKGSCRNSATQK
jgi:hypothetical protein